MKCDINGGASVLLEYALPYAQRTVLRPAPIQCDAMYHSEPNNFYDKCIRELISLFFWLVLLFLFVSSFCLFLYFNSLPSSCHAVICHSLFGCVILKGLLLLFPCIIFIWVDYSHSTEKLRCLLWGAGIFLRSLRSFFEQPTESRINLT